MVSEMLKISTEFRKSGTFLFFSAVLCQCAAWLLNVISGCSKGLLSVQWWFALVVAWVYSLCSTCKTGRCQLLVVQQKGIQMIRSMLLLCPFSGLPKNKIKIRMGFSDITYI